ncbi:NAD(+) synthase [bacterium]|nr:NAD(+) synthase [bacterium]
MFDRNVLDLDLEREAREVGERLRDIVQQRLHCRGLVVGVSGGIDSSVTCALAARALGPGRVLAVLMPERHSDSASTRRGLLLAEALGVAHTVEDIAPALEAIGCYRRYDAAVRRVVPDYGDGWRSKLVLPGDLLDSDRVNISRLVVRSPGGEESTVRLPADVYLELVAATNFKQRIRKTLEYFHADRLRYAVAGTPNRLEYDQGFFVKNGDGSADVKPIAHLYKTQVYALARHLGLPAEICGAEPTTDTFSLPQTQTEFYFALPYREMDLLLWARSHAVPAPEAAAALDLQPVQVERVYRDIERKRAVAVYLHEPPVLVRPVASGPG